MISIAVVEDDKACIQQFSEYIKQYGRETGIEFELALFSNGMDFVSDYKGGYDIIFMDIVMPHMDGLEAAHRLRAVDRHACLVFITSMAQYAIRGYEVHALDFVIKPVGYELFCIKLEKAIASLRLEKVYRIPVANGMRKVRLSEIVYIESMKHYLYFHILSDHEIDCPHFAGVKDSISGEEILSDEVYRMRGMLREIRDYFLKNQFAAANSSLLLNVSYVDGFQGNEVSILGKTFLISRKYKAAFLDKLTACMCQPAGSSRRKGDIV